MKLEACPLCQLVSSGSESGEYCVKGELAYHPFQPQSLLGETIHKVSVVVLKEHGSTPSADALVEAVDMLRPSSRGMIEEISQVAGHWGLWVMPGDWSGFGKSHVK